MNTFLHHFAPVLYFSLKLKVEKADTFHQQKRKTVL